MLARLENVRRSEAMAASADGATEAGDEEVVPGRQPDPGLGNPESQETDQPIRLQPWHLIVVVCVLTGLGFLVLLRKKLA